MFDLIGISTIAGVKTLITFSSQRVVYFIHKFIWFHINYLCRFKIILINFLFDFPNILKKKKFTLPFALHNNNNNNNKGDAFGYFSSLVSFHFFLLFISPRPLPPPFFHLNLFILKFCNFFFF